MEVEEDPEEDLDIDIDKDEEDEWEEDGDWLMAPVTPPRAVSLTSGERLVSVVASRVALHHREIGALYVRADKMEDMQTRALPLLRKVDGVSDPQVPDNKLDETEDTGSNFRYCQFTVVVKAKKSGLLQTLACLSASESNERCMVAYMLWMEERISALELRPQGPPDGTQIMPPRRLKRRDVESLVSSRVAEAITDYAEIKKIERYIRGLLKKVKANVTSSKPANLHKAINLARELVEKAIQAKATRIEESNKRK
ncbi:hypothetical protein Tco_1336843 [Tanacetum coccineum]